ncbi:MAG: hypothetical protein VX730_07150 [Pseudomonadota bacterium]|nr:hypothetical protein [Pseudomonadota bacterium]
MSRTIVEGFHKGSAHELATLLMERTIEEIHVPAKGNVDFIAFKLDGNDKLTILQLANSLSAGNDGEIKLICTNWHIGRPGDFTKSPVVRVEEEVRLSAIHYKIWCGNHVPIEITIFSSSEETVLLRDAGLVKEFDNWDAETLKLKHNFITDTMRHEQAA